MSPQLPSWALWLQALGPTCIAAAVAYIAWRQWQTASAKLKLDLFDKRFAVFKNFSDAVSEWRWDRATAEDCSKRINEMKQQAQFLFGSDVNQIIAEIDRLAFEVRNAAHLRDDPNFGPAYPQEIGDLVAKTVKHPLEMIRLVAKLADAVRPAMSMV